MNIFIEVFSQEMTLLFVFKIHALQTIIHCSLYSYIADVIYVVCASEPADSNGYHLIVCPFFSVVGSFFFAILFLMWCHLTMSLYVASNEVSLARLLHVDLFESKWSKQSNCCSPEKARIQKTPISFHCSQVPNMPLQSHWGLLLARNDLALCHFALEDAFFWFNNSYNHTYVFIFLRSVFVNDHISLFLV